MGFVILIVILDNLIQGFLSQIGDILRDVLDFLFPEILPVIGRIAAVLLLERPDLGTCVLKSVFCRHLFDGFIREQQRVPGVIDLQLIVVFVKGLSLEFLEQTGKIGEIVIEVFR